MKNADVLEDLISRLGISMKMKKVPSNPIILSEEPDSEAEHYMCRLSKGGDSLDVYLSTERGDGRLTRSDVLFMLAMDGSGCKMLQGFDSYREEWREAFGGSDGNLEELDAFWKEYAGRCQQTEKVKNFLGDSIYDTLLNHFEQQGLMQGAF